MSSESFADCCGFSESELTFVAHDEDFLTAAKILREERAKITDDELADKDEGADEVEESADAGIGLSDILDTSRYARS